MYSIYTTIWVTILINIPNCQSCDKLYVLFEEYFDDVFGIMTFRQILRKDLPYDIINIETNVSHLEDFNKNCIADLDCAGIEVKECREKPVIPKNIGIDERHITNKTLGKTNIPGSVSTTPTYNDTLISSTTEPNSTSNSTTESTTTVLDSEVDSKENLTTTRDSHSSLNESAPEMEKNETVTENYLSKETAEPKDYINMFDNELDDFLEYPIEDVMNNTDCCNETEIIDPYKFNITNATDAMLDKMLQDRDPMESGYLATNIVMGVLGGAVFLVLLFMAKKNINNCLQSATYHLPEA